MGSMFSGMPAGGMGSLMPLLGGMAAGVSSPAGDGQEDCEPGVRQLVQELVALAGFVKELETQSHLVHLNYEGGNFLSVHELLKTQYEAHLEQFDTVAELVRSLDCLMPQCAKGLMECVCDFEPCCSYDGQHMLMTYLSNLETLGEQAKRAELTATRIRALDVSNYLAELTGAAYKSAWLIKAILRGC